MDTVLWTVGSIAYVALGLIVARQVWQRTALSLNDVGDGLEGMANTWALVFCFLAWPLAALIAGGVWFVTHPSKKKS